MAKLLLALAWLLVITQAAPSEISQSHPLKGENSIAPRETDSADRTALFGKKVELTITKEVVKNPLALGLLPPVTAPAPPAVTTAAPAITPAPVEVTPAPPLPELLPPLLPLLPPVPVTTAAPAHVHHHHHHHVTAAPPLPPVLHLDNHPIVIDNATVTSLLQQLLAGNIKNVQAYGRPLVVPPGGKPVAVVFSAALHVVDIGNLLPAVKPTAHPAHHPAHVHLPHAHTTRAPILEGLLQSLHLLTNAKEHAIASAAMPASSQPLIVMVPLSAPGKGAALPAVTVAQLESVILGLKKAKKQILLAKHQALHAAHLVTPPPAPVTPAPPPAPLLPAAATTEVPSPVPVPLPIIKKVKKVEFSITKNVG